jgi:hypothetical protein
MLQRRSNQTELRLMVFIFKFYVDSKNVSEKFLHRSCSIMILKKKQIQSHERVGPKVSTKIKVYILSRAELIHTLCNEIPCTYVAYSKLFRSAEDIDFDFC